MTEHKLLENCIPINSYTLNKVWNKIKEVLGDNYKLSPLGSFNKKPEGSLYNDLDIAIECDWKYKDHIKDLIVSYLGSDLIVFGHDNDSLHVFNIACKLDEGKYVQVDFMFVNNLDYAEFAYHAPYYWESKYKGMYASILLQSAFKNIPMNVQYFEDGSVKEWEYYSLCQKDGLHLKHKTFIGKRGEKVKSARTINDTFVTDNPNEILNILTGDNPYKTLNDVWIFERLLDFITTLDGVHFPKSYLKEYLENVKHDFLNDWQFKLKTSEDLQKEFEELFNKKINNL